MIFLAYAWLILLTSLATLLFAPRRWLPNPAAFFVGFQLVFAASTFTAIDYTVPADRAYVVAIAVGLGAFLLGAWVCHLAVVAVAPGASEYRGRLVKDAEGGRTLNAVVWGIIAFSVLVTVLYYAAVGEIFLVASIRSVVAGAGPLADPAGVRLQAYAGDRYLAPGYVNQFKNTLLPLLVIFVVFRAHRRDVRHWGIRGGLVAFTLFALMGTGQRAPLLTVGVVTTIVLLSVLRRHQRWLVGLPILGVFLGLAVLGTVLLDRGAASSRTAGGLHAAAAASQLFSRAVAGNVQPGIHGFRYVYERPIEYGTEWLRGVRGLAPGMAGSGLSHDIHAMLYGTRRGTAPISIWGSIWHNWGWGGVLAVPFMMGVGFHALYVRYIRGDRRLLRFISFVFMTVILGRWISGGPVNMLNQGALTVAIFLAVVSLVQRRRGRQTHAMVPYVYNRGRALTGRGSYYVIRPVGPPSV